MTLGMWMVWLALVAIGSLLPGNSTEISILGIWMKALGVTDKVVHALAYIPLAFVPAVLFSSLRRILWSCAGLAGMGLALEVGQALVPGRTPDWGDFAANDTGLVLGLAAGLMWQGLRARRPNAATSRILS